MSYPNHSKTRFFKYTSSPTAIKILETATVRYSSPLLFNDPFDIQSGLHFDFDIEAFPDKLLNHIKQLVESEHEPRLALHDPMGNIISLMREKKSMHGILEQLTESVLRLTLPRFYRHPHKGENGKIGGDYVSKNPTSIYQGI